MNRLKLIIDGLPEEEKLKILTEFNDGLFKIEKTVKSINRISQIGLMITSYGFSIIISIFLLNLLKNIIF